MNLRFGRIALAMAAAGLLAACTSTPTWPPPDTYFIGAKPVRAQREHLHRYMCAGPGPLQCQCASLYHGACDCRC